MAKGPGSRNNLQIMQEKPSLEKFLQMGTASVQTKHIAGQSFFLYLEKIFASNI